MCRQRGKRASLELKAQKAKAEPRRERTAKTLLPVARWISLPALTS
jgi:hypothetical protein